MSKETVIIDYEKRIAVYKNKSFKKKLIFDDYARLMHTTYKQADLEELVKQTGREQIDAQPYLP